MKIKAWHHTSLAVCNLDRSAGFYAAAFGYRVTFEERGITREIRAMTGQETLSCDLAVLVSAWSDQMLELIAFKGDVPEDLAVPLPAGAAHIAFTVEALDHALGEVKGFGATQIGSVTSFPEGRAVYCREPGGSFFELQELADENWADG